LKEYQWYDTKYYTVPNVIGKNINEAKKELKQFQIEYTGSGDVVISQEPQEGVRIPENSVIRLFLSN